MSNTKSTPLPILDGVQASADPEAQKINLLGHTFEALQELVQSMNERAYRAEQLFTGIFNKRCLTFSQITNLSKPLRSVLDSQYSLARPMVDTVQVSQDGTRKYGLRASDGLAFEAVYIPNVGKSGRTNTLCVSSQTGCAVGCTFCFTASLRRNRNLETHEIVGQVLAVRDDVASIGNEARVTNIVFMGMGEPLLNYDNVKQAITVLLDVRGCDFSTRRITVSTSGIVPRIYDLGRDLNTQLAVSLNATTNAQRTAIMPINKKWPIEELIEAMRAYPLANRRRITVEYVLLHELNDSPEDAKRLAHLLNGIPVKVNILPLNAHERTSLRTPPNETVERFVEDIRKYGLNGILRTPRGQDISAACGQLGGALDPVIHEANVQKPT